MVWVQNSRMYEACAKAATPPNVNGCQAAGGEVDSLEGSEAGCGLKTFAIDSFRRFWTGGCGGAGRSDNDDRNGKPQFHHVIHQDFDRIDARRGELDVAEKRHRRGVDVRVLHREADLTLAE